MERLEEVRARHGGGGLGVASAEFAGQVAAAVWLCRLTDEGAREALRCYATACHPSTRQDANGLLQALLAEYGRRREQQDLCW